MISPMMQHYISTKEQHQDAILFYRLGDFYEMFFEDAEIVSRELELTLTGKDCGLEERAPMCGIPYHAANSYIAKLISNGHKVAICEQVSDPKSSKGLVQREVVQIITPGTIIDNESLISNKNNYFMAVFESKTKIGVCYSDISTGFIEATNNFAEKCFKHPIEVSILPKDQNGMKILRENKKNKKIEDNKKQNKNN